MTPAEHLAEAERLLAEAADVRAEWGGSGPVFTLQAALIHAVIAAAAEMGVPHAPEQAGGSGASTG